MNKDLMQIVDIILRMQKEAEEKYTRDIYESAHCPDAILAEYMLSIKHRDGYQCMECAEIKGVRVYRIYLPSYKAANLITLCPSCGEKIKANQEKYRSIICSIYDYPCSDILKYL